VRVRAEGQGWTDSEVVMSLILLNLAGGECVEDLNRLEGVVLSGCYRFDQDDRVMVNLKDRRGAPMRGPGLMR